MKSALLWPNSVVCITAAAQEIDPLTAIELVAVVLAQQRIVTVAAIGIVYAVPASKEVDRLPA